MLLGYSKKTLYGVFFILPLLIIWAFYQYQTLHQTQQAETQALNDASNQLTATCPTLSDFKKNQIKSAKVKWLPDGDTIHTTSGLKLRLLHINTPETNSKQRAAEPFAKKAQQTLNKLIGPSKTIYWVSDAKKKDKYGRELALVFNQQGLFINALLLAEGLAHSLIIPPNQAYWSCINRSQQKAYQMQKGIWSKPLQRATGLSTEKEFNGVYGKITSIQQTHKYQWIVIDNKLWVGIPNQYSHYFKNDARKKFQPGQSLALVGYLYHSHSKLRVKLNHPGMILE